MASDVTVSRHGADEALAMLDEILPVYTAAESAQMHDPFFWPDKFVHRLRTIYAPAPGFELVTARIDGKLIGYAFGRPRTKSEEIWAAVLRQIPDVPVPDTPSPVFIFCEFQVDPSHQRNGYGRKIHDTLFGGRPEKLAHLLVRKDNIPARAAYFAWGWIRLGEQQPFPDAPVFDELIKILPLSSPPTAPVKTG